MAKKLQSQSGESLVETLVSVVIAIISVTLLLMAAATAASLGSISKSSDKAFQEALELAETRSGAPVTTGTVHIKETTELVTPLFDSKAKVDLYGAEDLYSYSLSITPDTPVTTSQTVPAEGTPAQGTPAENATPDTQ